MPTPNFRAPPTVAAKTDPHAAHRNADLAALPWTIRQAGLPTRPADASTHASHDTITLQQAMDIAAARGMTRMGPRLRVFYPENAESVFTLSLVPARAQDQRTIYLDPRDGTIVQDIGWNEYSPLGHAVEWGVMTHMGRQFGEPNRWLALSICIGIVVSVIAGIVMWWRRRPHGGIGVPDAVLGEVGRVYVIPKPGSNLREADVRNWCAEHLADYKVPRQVVLRDALPLTPAGKIHKAALRAEA